MMLQHYRDKFGAAPEAAAAASCATAGWHGHSQDHMRANLAQARARPASRAPGIFACSTPPPVATSSPPAAATFSTSPSSSSETV